MNAQVLRAVLELCSLLLAPPRSLTPCRNGPSCLFEASGRCLFAHAGDDPSKQSTTSSTTHGPPSSYDRPPWLASVFAGQEDPGPQVPPGYDGAFRKSESPLHGTVSATYQNRDLPHSCAYEHTHDTRQPPIPHTPHTKARHTHNTHAHAAQHTHTQHTHTTHTHTPHNTRTTHAHTTHKRTHSPYTNTSARAHAFAGDSEASSHDRVSYHRLESTDVERGGGGGIGVGYKWEGPFAPPLLLPPYPWGRAGTFFPPSPPKEPRGGGGALRLSKSPPSPRLSPHFLFPQPARRLV